MTSIIAFIFVFGVLVTVHEFGHFIAAKRAGVLVREFSIGMGPKILRFNRHHTAYTIRILPVGGYVRMAGMEEEADLEPGQRVRLLTNENNVVTQIDTQVDVAGQGIAFNVDHADLVDDLVLVGYLENDDAMHRMRVDREATIIEKDGTTLQVAPRETWFQSAKVWKRMVINIAGPLMNFILALIVFSGLGFTLPAVNLNEPIVGHVQDNMPAKSAGLKTGDRITAINDTKIHEWADIANAISTNQGETVNVKVSRQDQQRNFKLTPKTISENGQETHLLGIEIQMHKDFNSRLKYGFVQTLDTTKRVLYALSHLFVGGFSLDKLGGPVSIAKATSSVAQTGFINILGFMALLSINLGIMNLLPIPALDGGKIILNLLELIRRKPLPASFETGVTIVGAIFMVLLMLAVTVNDILR